MLDELNEIANTIDESTLEDTSSDSEPDDTLYTDSIDEDDDEINNNHGSVVYKLDNVTGHIFPGIRIFDSIDSSKSSSYFKVQIDGKEKFMHKQTACWLFTEEKTALSADRLRRVIQQNKKS